MGLIGAADNFGEATPQINRRETILGLCITFTVWAGFRGHEKEGTDFQSGGAVVGLCGVQVIRQIRCDEGSWMG